MGTGRKSSPHRTELSAHACRWYARIVVRMLRWLVSVLLLTSSCSFDSIDFSGRACPCIEGYHCLDGICVLGSGVDAGTDGSRPDGSVMLDAGPLPDAAVPDAGPLPDAGPPDAGPARDSCWDSHPGAIFCSGFETPDFADWPDRNEVDGSVSIAPTAHSGTGALLATTTSPDARAQVVFDGLGGLDSGDLWVRMWMRASTGRNYNHLSILNTENAGGDRTLAFLLYYALPTLWETGDRSTNGPDPIPRDRWVCVEMHVAIDDVAGRLEAWVDDPTRSRTMAVGPFDTRPTGGWAEVKLGIAGYGTDGQLASELLLDDFVVATAPVGCD